MPSSTVTELLQRFAHIYFSIHMMPVFSFLNTDGFFHTRQTCDISSFSMCPIFYRLQEKWDELAPETIWSLHVAHVCEETRLSGEKLWKQFQADFGPNSSSTAEEIKQEATTFLEGKAAATQRFVQQTSIHDRSFFTCFQDKLFSLLSNISFSIYHFISG